MTATRASLQSYKDLLVWQKGLGLVLATYRFTATLPSGERYGLVTQLQRAAASIPANIAEGYGRATRGEYLNQLSIANGSLCELETLCIVCAALNFGDAALLLTVKEHATELQRMLTRMRQKLRPPKRSGPKSNPARYTPNPKP